MKVSYEPLQNLVIHNIAEFDLDTLVKIARNNSIISQSYPGLDWCDGILFDYTRIAKSEDVIKDEMNGIHHWRYIHYAHMPDFKEKFPLDNGVLLVTNVSKNPFFKEVIKFIKEDNWKNLVEPTLTSDRRDTT
jgi:hypothetical protein